MNVTGTFTLTDPSDRTDVSDAMTLQGLGWLMADFQTPDVAELTLEASYDGAEWYPVTGWYLGGSDDKMKRTQVTPLRLAQTPNGILSYRLRAALVSGQNGPVTISWRVLD